MEASGPKLSFRTWGKLFAAITGGHVGLTQCLAQNLADSDQNRVPFRVTTGISILLKRASVKQSDGKRGLMTLRAGKLLLRRLAKSAMAFQTVRPLHNEGGRILLTLQEKRLIIAHRKGFMPRCGGDGLRVRPTAYRFLPDSTQAPQCRELSAYPPSCSVA